MRMYTLALLLLATLNLCSQENNFDPRTITITGSAEYNLSPNEIVIKVGFQEYFKDINETPGSKVTIEELEPQVLKAIYAAGIAKDKVTVGEVKIVQPWQEGNRRIKKRRRLNKTLLVCVNSTEAYVDLTRKFEKENLFDKIITNYNILEYRHTEKDDFLSKSRNEAYKDAVAKADLILNESGNKRGTVLRITEFSARQRPEINDQSMYSMSTGSEATPSGFRPIVVGYKLEVTFEIL